MNGIVYSFMNDELCLYTNDIIYIIKTIDAPIKSIIKFRFF